MSERCAEALPNEPLPNIYDLPDEPLPNLHLYLQHVPLTSLGDTCQVSERFGLLLQEYLRCCGPHRDELILQNTVEVSVLALNKGLHTGDGRWLGLHTGDGRWMGVVTRGSHTPAPRQPHASPNPATDHAPLDPPAPPRSYSRTWASSSRR